LDEEIISKCFAASNGLCEFLVKLNLSVNFKIMVLIKIQT